MLSIFAIPIVIITYLLRPCVIATTAITRVFIVCGLGQQYRDTRPVFELTDLQTFIKHSLNISQPIPAGISATIVGKFINFRKLRVRDCMVPRKEIVAISVTDGVKALKKIAIRSEHAKILIYRNDIDDIIGYCHAKELFKKPKHIESILTPVVVVAQTSLASAVMVQLTSEGKSLALVVDEFGGTSGIISLEDIIGEILGSIREEYDNAGCAAQKLDKTTYLLSARCGIDNLNDKYNLELPRGDYDTLSGFITSATGRIPKVSEIIKIPPFTFTIVSIEDTHIDTVKMEMDCHTPLRDLAASLDPIPK
ncbi:MAG: transporter associated domain-containing protein [Bacteroidota bacterium]